MNRNRARTSIPPSSRNSARSRTAGGIPKSEFRPLHEINPLRLAHIERLAGGLAGKRVLDVGCGGGILAEAMAAQGRGGDRHRPRRASRSRSRCCTPLETGSRVDYRLVSAEEMAAEAPGIVRRRDLHGDARARAPSTLDVCAACAELVKPGGQVFFSTINRNPKSFLFAIVGAEHVLSLLPKGTHEYARFIRPSELAADCRERRPRGRRPHRHDLQPALEGYSLGRDVDVNYLLACRK